MTSPPWAPEEDERALSGASVAEMAKQMKRSAEAVRSRAYRLKIVVANSRNKTVEAEGEGEMTMRVLLILAAIICFSASAFGQTGTPKVGGKPLKQVKPLVPTGCKLVGTVKGTKLWAGDCAAASELRGTTPATERAPTPEASPPAADKQ